jgi:hypothetical protein
MTPDKVDVHLRRRPSVHQICLGAYLAQAMFVTQEVLAVPLEPVGFDDVATFIGGYVAEDLQCEIKIKHVDALKEIGKNAYPAISLVWYPVADAPDKVLEMSALSAFDKARQVLTWVTGDEITPVGYVNLHNVGVAFNLLPPRSRMRQKAWFDLKEIDQLELLAVRLSIAAKKDSNLGLALEMFHDATRERNDRFRIVRLFNVLECLASRYKQAGKGSRDAVREMLGIKPGQTCVVPHNGNDVSFDLIAVAGRLRDKIMHGAPVREDAFAPPDRAAFALLTEQPNLIAHELQRQIEGEISRRALV